MNLKTAIKVLTRHNKWRRGADIEMTNPAQLGKAIDKILNHLEKEDENSRS